MFDHGSWVLGSWSIMRLWQGGVLLFVFFFAGTATINKQGVGTRLSLDQINWMTAS